MPNIYATPLTRGELRDLLNAGVDCEVVEFTATFTALMLKDWLDCTDFSVIPSEREGWVVFKSHYTIKDSHK